MTSAKEWDAGLVKVLGWMFLPDNYSERTLGVMTC